MLVSAELGLEQVVVLTEKSETGNEVAQEPRVREALETIGEETLETCKAWTLSIGGNRDSLTTETHNRKEWRLTGN